LSAFFWAKPQNLSDELARTVAVDALTLGQIFYLLNSRYLLDSSLSIKSHLGNRYLPIGIGAVVLLQLFFTYAPPFQSLFNTEAIPLRLWPGLVAGLSRPYVVHVKASCVRAECAAVAQLRRLPRRSARRAMQSSLALIKMKPRSTQAPTAIDTLLLTALRHCGLAAPRPCARIIMLGLGGISRPYDCVAPPHQRP
jgi:cation transport ATPase-like protein